MSNENCISKSCQDQKIAFSEYCWTHAPDKDKYVKTLESKIKETGSLKNLNLAKVVLRNFELSRLDLENINLTRADLSGSNLFDVNLKNAEMLGANLSNCDLTSADLDGADLTRANLFEVRLWHANLINANLIEANLAQADLWNAKLYNVKLWRTSFSNSHSLSKSNFYKKKNRFVTICSINEKGLHSAEDAYRTLKKLFLSEGRYDDASWASYREKNMEKLLLKKKRDITFIPSFLMNALCGYGEKPARIILSSFIVILSYSFTYYLTGAIEFAKSASYKMGFYDYLYYSIITFTTVGYGDFIPKSFVAYRLIAASEAFVGTFMIGLFIFTLARKYSGR